ncbi:unnamed protein product [Angiostrongylus costaricensis]|uniref:Cation_ATPase_N domain-containing protein n=1 Tax=Angiostrongylus costaricensis TaxID=334426 RepID=A0A158PHJ5_ANGCS|nr:unnamed protein product [Angiostrongylus costaricensis]
MIETLSAEKASAHDVSLFKHCLNVLRSDCTNGISSAEATLRRQYHGYNEFDVLEQEPLWKKYTEQFRNPLILLLLASAFVSLLMRQFDDAVSITVAVVIVVTVGFVQEYRSEKTLEQLNKLVPPSCHVFQETEPITTYNGGGHVEHMVNIAFMGTLVCSGRGKGLVISIAANSQFGEVFRMMQGEEFYLYLMTFQSPKTPLQNSMDQLGKQLSFYSFGVIILIFVIGLVQGRKVLDMFTIGVSLAVAAIPEGLPIVVAVTLAIGVMRMAGRRAVVKKMPAVETLGCVTVICSDKTGTLTKNEMTATCVVTPEGRRAEVTGLGYIVSGGQCTFEGELVMGYSHQEFASIIEVGVVCNNAKIVADTVVGQPTEGALVVLAQKTGLEGCRQDYRRLREVPFTSESKWMSVQCEKNGKAVLFVKGALDRILPLCDSYFSADGTRKPLDEYVRQRITDGGRGLGATGLRVLAMARGDTMQSLMLVGMVGMLDPPRLGAPGAISMVKASGVEVKLITGDSQETAQSIGSMLGLYSSPRDSCLSGAQMDSMSDQELELVIRQVSIFYRASPRHKLKIVKALQGIGEVVAMTGDGVNDAVALKKADIGVAMGLGGTDVCKGRSVAALSLIAASTMFHFENPLNAMQILWINIIMDGPPAQSLGVEPVDDNIIRQPPRNVRQPMLTVRLMIDILCSAAIIVFGTLFIFYKEMSADSKVTPRDTTMTFTCFVLFDMWNALSCRSSRKMIWQIGLLRNRMFCIAVTASLICQLFVIYWSPLQHIFQTEALSLLDIVLLSTMTSSVFIFNETRKYFDLRRTGIHSKTEDLL